MWRMHRQTHGRSYWPMHERRTDEITCVTLYYPITLEWHEKKNYISVMCSVVYWSFARTRSVLNRIMLCVLRILFFSTHHLKIAKFTITDIRKSNVLALIWMMWDTFVIDVEIDWKKIGKMTIIFIKSTLEN